MKKYQFSFNGRQTGAIGIFYKIYEEYKANSLDEAVSMLYVDYEHITFISGKEESDNVSPERFKKSAYTNFKTDYKGKGMQRK